MTGLFPEGFLGELATAQVVCIVKDEYVGWEVTKQFRRLDMKLGKTWYRISYGNAN